MLFSINLNLLLHLDNGNIALSSILIDSIHEFDKERINNIVNDFKCNFETKNNVSILKIDYLSNQQAEKLKNDLENPIDFKKDKYLLILKETKSFLEEYLDILCKQQIELSPEHKTNDFIVSINIFTTNIVYLLQKANYLQNYIQNTNTLKIIDKKKKNLLINNLNLLIKFFRNIPEHDHILHGLNKLKNEIDKNSEQSF